MATNFKTMKELYYIRLSNDYEQSLELFKQFLNWGKEQGYNIYPEWFRHDTTEEYVRINVRVYGDNKVCYFSPVTNELNGSIFPYFSKSLFFHQFDVILWTPNNDNISIF